MFHAISTLSVRLLLIAGTICSCWAQSRQLKYLAITGWYGNGCSLTDGNRCGNRPFIPLSDPLYLELGTCYVNPSSSSSVTFYKRTPAGYFVEFNIIFTQDIYAAARMPQNCTDQGACHCGPNFQAIIPELRDDCNGLFSITYLCYSRPVQLIRPSMCYAPSNALLPQSENTTSMHCSMMASLESIPPTPPPPPPPQPQSTPINTTFQSTSPISSPSGSPPLPTTIPSDDRVADNTDGPTTSLALDDGAVDDTNGPTTSSETNDTIPFSPSITPAPVATTNTNSDPPPPLLERNITNPFLMATDVPSIAPTPAPTFRAFSTEMEAYRLCGGMIAGTIAVGLGIVGFIFCSTKKNNSSNNRKWWRCWCWYTWSCSCCSSNSKVVRPHRKTSIATTTNSSPLKTIELYNDDEEVGLSQDFHHSFKKPTASAYDMGPLDLDLTAAAASVAAVDARIPEGSRRSSSSTAAREERQRAVAHQRSLDSASTRSTLFMGDSSSSQSTQLMGDSSRTMTVTSTRSISQQQQQHVDLTLNRTLQLLDTPVTMASSSAMSSTSSEPSSLIRLLTDDSHERSTATGRSIAARSTATASRSIFSYSTDSSSCGAMTTNTTTTPALLSVSVVGSSVSTGTSTTGGAAAARRRNYSPLTGDSGGKRMRQQQQHEQQQQRRRGRSTSQSKSPSPIKLRLPK